jgi:peroxiredoxin
MVTNGMTVETAAVEPDPTQITISGADQILAQL